MKNVKNYKPTVCPICGEFYFSKFTQEDIDDNIKPEDLYCFVCGWKYDISQLNDPNFLGRNEKTIPELKDDFRAKRKKNRHYNFLEANAPKPQKHLCPVCGKYTFKDIDSFDICPICGWEDDSYGEEFPDSGGGANSTSLNDMKKIYQSKLKK